MRHALLLIILLGTQIINVHAWEIDQISSVTKIVDGDSFIITSDEVRPADINAPEWNQPGGTQATTALTSLISGKTIYLDTDDKSGRDQYGRLVAVVYIMYNSTHYLNVNKELLQEGTVVLDNFKNNEFDPSTWTLYVQYAYLTPPASYTLVIQSPDGLGSTNPTIGSYTYSNSVNVPVQATPADGWVFDHWQLNGSNVGSSNPFNVLMSTSRELTAVFKQILVSVHGVIIDQTSVSSQRCDVSSRQFVWTHAKWDNGSDVLSGSIKINDDITIFNSTGWAKLSEISNVPAKRVYFVKAVNCSGVTEFTQAAGSPSIIWDRVDDTLSIPNDRIDVGSNASIEWTAEYAFDGTPFKGSVVFSSPLRGDFPDDVPGQSLHIDDVGKRRFTADAIHDDQYGLTWFTTNSVDCVWDRVRITQGGVSNQLTKTGNMETVWFKAVYEYDYSNFTGEPTDDGGMNKITVNGIPMIWSSFDKEWKYSIKLDENGKLTFEVTGVEDMQYKLTKFVDDAGPQSITWEKPFLETPVGIVSIIVTLGLVAAGVLFFIRKRF